MHFPKLSLVARALGRFSGCESRGVNLIERNVIEHIFDLAGSYVVLLYLRQRLAEEQTAVGTLIVRELNHYNTRTFVAAVGSLSDADLFRRRGFCRRLPRQELLLYLAQLFAYLFLTLLEFANLLLYCFLLLFALLSICRHHEKTAEQRKRNGSTK